MVCDPDTQRLHDLDGGSDEQPDVVTDDLQQGFQNGKSCPQQRSEHLRVRECLDKRLDDRVRAFDQKRQIFDEDLTEHFQDGDPRLQHQRQVLGEGICQQLQGLPCNAPDAREPFFDPFRKALQDARAKFEHVGGHFAEAGQQRQGKVDAGFDDLVAVRSQPVKQCRNDGSAKLDHVRQIVADLRERLAQHITERLCGALCAVRIERICDLRHIGISGLYKLPERAVHGLVHGIVKPVHGRFQIGDIAVEVVHHGFGLFGSRAERTVFVVCQTLVELRDLVRRGHDHLVKCSFALPAEDHIFKLRSILRRVIFERSTQVIHNGIKITHISGFIICRNAELIQGFLCLIHRRVDVRHCCRQICGSVGAGHALFRKTQECHLRCLRGLVVGACDRRRALHSFTKLVNIGRRHGRTFGDDVGKIEGCLRLVLEFFRFLCKALHGSGNELRRSGKLQTTGSGKAERAVDHGNGLLRIKS